MMKTVRMFPAVVLGALMLGGCAENTVAPFAEASVIAPADSLAADRMHRGTDPIARILRRSDDLALTSDQVARLTAIQARLSAATEPLQDQLRATMGDRPARAQRGTPPTAAERENLRARMEQARPFMEQLRTLNQGALAEARGVLTADQQSRLGSARAGGARERGSGEHRSSGPRGAIRGGPGEVGDAGPVAMMLRRADALGLTADQVERIEAIGARLAAQNDPLQQQIRSIMGEMRPGGRDRSAPPSAAEREAMRTRMEQARPLMEQVRTNAAAAREEALAVLSEEQRARLRDVAPGRGR